VKGDRHVSIRRVSREEVDAELAEAARRYGRTFEEVTEAWCRDDLDEPELRDLWLIWWGGSGRCAEGYGS
jgi:hypothetical protein